MNANQKIAIEWAEFTTSISSGAVYSTEFFAPFNQEQSIDICSKLAKSGIVVLSVIDGASKPAMLVKNGNYKLVSEKIEGGVQIGDCTKIIALHKFAIKAAKKEAQRKSRV